MPTPTNASIRPFRPDDLDKIRFAIGHSKMEQLAVANKKVYYNPILLSIWVALSCVMIQYMQWWPKSEFSYWAYLSPLPAFGAMAVPFMFAVDWLNRPYFEEAVARTLRQSDMCQVQSYYTSSSASAFWVLEYQERVIGLLALDAASDASQLQSLKDIVASKTPLSPTTKGVSHQTAWVRHFWVDEQYRPSSIQDDLLRHAIGQASARGIRTLKISLSQLEQYKTNSLSKSGFTPCEGYSFPSIGILGWKEIVLQLKITA